MDKQRKSEDGSFFGAQNSRKKFSYAEIIENCIRCPYSV